MRQGQVATETLVIFGILLILFVVAFSASYDQYQQYQDAADVGMTRVAVQELSHTMERLCRLPPGSRETVRTHLPPTYSPTESVVGGASGRALALGVRTADTVTTLTAVTDCDLRGTVPDTGGTYHPVLRREQGGIVINWTGVS